ncbi:hypothetical protein [Roseburia sp. 499]|uniref:hypothetical protein n=1 Tax=Roseburia sp. 499 TaxID=1261634 RepID=UPI001179B6D9|nr:hypothetical protein [Roseburia sp. 499]WVK69817.1 hypothetical protein BIV20_15995 [Roseburia sp. 499]
MKNRRRILPFFICIIGIVLLAFLLYRKEFEENNYTKEELIYLEDVRYYADALNMYVYRDTSSGEVQAGFKKGGKEALIETIEKYNAVKDNQVEMESLLDDYNKVLEGNEPSEELYQFAWWLTE